MVNVKEEARTSAVLEEMLREINPAQQNPSTLKLRDVIRGGIEDIPAPMIVQAINEAGYTLMYHTKDGDRRLVHKNMVKGMLQKKNDDGSYAFSAKAGLAKAMKPTLKCLLHISDENRAQFETLGLPICDREGIPNPYQQRMHMIRKHKQEWAIMELQREEREKQEQKDWQQNLLGRAVTSGTSTAAPVETRVPRKRRSPSPAP